MFIVFPVGTDHNKQKIPYLTYIIIFINCLVFALTYFRPGISQETIANIVNSLGFIPEKPLHYTIITSMFMHGGFLHLLGNMLYLFVFGTDVEDATGKIKYIILYIASGIAAVIIHSLWAKFFAEPKIMLEPCIGASGAISGLLGFYCIRFFKHKVRLFAAYFFGFIRYAVVRIGSLYFISFWIFLQILYGITATAGKIYEVAYFAHLGGFALGIFTGLILRSYKEGGVEFLMQEGIYKMQKNKWFDAEICFEKILKIESFNIPAASQLAICYEVTGSKRKLKAFVENTVNLFASKGNLNGVAEILKSCYNILDANSLTEFLQKYGNSVIDLLNTPLLRLISENDKIADNLRLRAVAILQSKKVETLKSLKNINNN